MSVFTLCVFCGSNFGNSPIFEDVTIQFADCMIQRNLSLVYGGGSRGLMGVVAKRLHDAGLQVIGVSPKRFHKEGKEIPSNEYVLVDTMHQRKDLMYLKADAFVALPGGIGTIEELAEIFTWNTIGFSSKPVGILNIDGFFDSFIQQLHVIEKYGFLSREKLDRLIIRTDPDEMLDALLNAPLVNAPWEIKV